MGGASIASLPEGTCEGDDVLENREEALKFYTDGVYIDQMRGGVNSGGRMTRKRTIHNLRKIARKRQSDWWARVFDELLFIYLSGARGINADYVFPTTYTGFANNSLSAPDSEHIQYADGLAKLTITSSAKMDLTEIDKAIAYTRSEISKAIARQEKLTAKLRRKDRHAERVTG